MITRVVKIILLLTLGYVLGQATSIASCGI